MRWRLNDKHEIKNVFHQSHVTVQGAELVSIASCEYNTAFQDFRHQEVERNLE